jgi:hypothetical protein
MSLKDSFLLLDNNEEILRREVGGGRAVLLEIVYGGHQSLPTHGTHANVAVGQNLHDPRCHISEFLCSFSHLKQALMSKLRLHVPLE